MDHVLCLEAEAVQITVQMFSCNSWLCLYDPYLASWAQSLLPAADFESAKSAMYCTVMLKRSCMLSPRSWITDFGTASYRIHST